MQLNRWSAMAVITGLLSISCHATTDSLQQQRLRYQQIRQAWDSKDMATVNALLPTLTKYPLYPYLQYRELSEDLSLLSLSTVKAFITRYPTLPPARNLHPRFVNELARRQEWRSLLSFSPEPPESTGARCNYYYAKWATGQEQVAWQGAAEVWQSGKSLPASCDKLFDVWKGTGKQTLADLHNRIRLAFIEGNNGLLAYLLRQLPQQEKKFSQALSALQDNPATVSTFARTFGPDNLSREITTVAFNRLARQDAGKAKAMLHGVASAQRMNSEQRLKLEEMIAWRWMGSGITLEQAAWRDQVIERSHDQELIERRIRVALGEGHRTGLTRWLARLSAENREKDEWVYWRATLLLEKGQKVEGKQLLQSLMQQRGFYPMAAAQKLQVAYPVKMNNAPAPSEKLRQRPEIARVRELMYWGMDNLASQEWRNLVSHSSAEQQEALARYAFEQRWADLSVQATIVAELWDHLQERFPLAWEQDFHQQTRTKGLSPSFAMAIARQESGWNPKVHSPAGAVGLMQLMPKTADHTASMYGIDRYSNSSQLLDPKLNIEVGTSYLSHVYHTFNRNRIFASAAYNAGPSRVNRWLENSGGRIDAIAFIASIPFNETRNYVKNVLAYDLFYRYFMQKPTQLLTDAEWGRDY